MKGDNRRDTVPFLRVKVPTGRVSVNYQAIEDLGLPASIVFLWNAASGVVAIAPGGDGDCRGVGVCVSCSAKRQEHAITRRKFVGMLAKQAGWAANGAYKLFGEHDSAQGIITFELNKAICCKMHSDGSEKD